MERKGRKEKMFCRNLSHGMERGLTISRGEIGKGSQEKEEEGLMEKLVVNVPEEKEE